MKGCKNSYWSCRRGYGRRCVTTTDLSSAVFWLYDIKSNCCCKPKFGGSSRSPLCLKVLQCGISCHSGGRCRQLLVSTSSSVTVVCLWENKKLAKFAYGKVAKGFEEFEEMRSSMREGIIGPWTRYEKVRFILSRISLHVIALTMRKTEATYGMNWIFRIQSRNFDGVFYSRMVEWISSINHGMRISEPLF